MRTYLLNLLSEKGMDIDAEIGVDGHIGLTWQMLVDYICAAKSEHKMIRNTLVKIDFLNGNVFHFLNHLTTGMLLAMGYNNVVINNVGNVKK